MECNAIKTTRLGSFDSIYILIPLGNCKFWFGLGLKCLYILCYVLYTLDWVSLFLIHGGRTFIIYWGQGDWAHMVTAWVRWLMAGMEVLKRRFDLLEEDEVIEEKDYIIEFKVASELFEEQMDHNIYFNGHCFSIDFQSS